jgi:hypothetical protein
MTMKLILSRFFPLIFFAIILISCQTRIQKIIPKTYNCDYTNHALIVDGILDDPQWEKAKWSDIFMDIEGAGMPVPKYNTQFKMLWDKYYLYIGAKLEEPDLWATLTRHDAIIYHDNDFEVFIDPDGDGLNYYEMEINALGTVLDLFLDKPYNKKGTADISWNFKRLNSAVHRYGTLNDPSDRDSGWTTEIAIPWEAFSANSPVPPKEGDKWRMNFSRVQWNLTKKDNGYKKLTDSLSGKNLPEYNWVWSPQGVVNMHVPEKWGTIQFTTETGITETKLPEFWIWMNGGNNRNIEDWDSIFRELRNIGITGLLINCDTTVLKKIIPLAKEKDMQIHAWLWTMNSMDAKAEWLSVNRLGQSLATHKAYVDYYKFMCPALPEVKDYLRSKLKSLTSIKGLDGIHMDYIRYVDAILPKGLWGKYGLVQDHIMPEYDYGYHPYMRKLYNARYGLDPFYIEHPEKDKNWLNFRLEELNKTVIDLRNYVNNSGLTISAAVFPTPDMSRKMVRQDWNKWRLDCYFPMVYHNFYNEKISWIKKVVAEDKANLPAGSHLYCGIFLPALQAGEDLTKAIDAAYSGGADGIAFFDFNALDENHIQQIENIIQTKNQQNR